MFKEFLEVPLPNEWWYVLMLVWVVFWKGMALWKASRLGQKWWFIGLLVINTFGILEIFYIYVFSKRSGHNRRSSDNEAHTTSAGILDNEAPIEEEKTEATVVKSEDLPAGEAGKKEPTSGTPSSV